MVAAVPQVEPGLLKIRKLYEDDFFLFCDQIMQPAQFGKSVLSPTLHREVCGWLGGIWDRDETYSVLMIPRGCLKSTVGTCYFVLWQLAKNPNLRILVAHGKLGAAKKFVRAIKGIMTRSTTLKRLWPDVFWENPAEEADVWLSEEINVRRTVDDPIPSISIASPESSVTGSHFHLHIWDDLSTNINSVTEGQRDKVKDWCREAENLIRPPDSILPSGGRVLDIGTPWHFDDCHAMLTSEEFKSETTTFIRGHFGEPGATDGEPIYPERWPKELVHRKAAKMGSHKAAAQLYCSPVAGDAGAFDKDDIVWYRAGQYPGAALATGETIPGNLRVFMSADPNRSEKTQNDPMAIIVAGLDEKGKIWLLDKFRGHPSGTEVLDKTEEFAKAWRPEMVFWEETNAQLQIYKMLRERFLASGVYIRIRAVVRGNTTKFARITAMQPLIESKGLQLRRGIDDDLANELSQYPNGKNDDMLDALADIFRFGVKPAPPEAPPVPKNPYTIDALFQRNFGQGRRSSGPSFGNTNSRIGGGFVA